jgi:AcrR family transcriptional regulator
MRIRTKQAAIVAAGRRLFMQQGFGGASMDAIAAEAGVSKATLYAYFRSKEELFSHVVASERTTPAAALGAAPAMPLPQRLNRIEVELAALILSDATAAMYRIIMSEGGSFPELGTRFYEAGPARLLADLATCLADAMHRGELMQAPPQAAATQFIGLILGDLQMRLLLHVGPPPTARHRAKTARAGTAAFLRAYRP